MKHGEAVLRYLDTLRALPLARWRTTADVHAALTAKGHQVSRRTVQRDLLKLAAPFGIDLDQVGTGNNYVWRRTRSLEDAAA